MKILFTADPHFRSPQDAWMRGFSESIERRAPDAIVVAGDIGSPSTFSGALGALRGAAGDCLMAITAGNHDYWLHPFDHMVLPRLGDVRRAHLAPAAKNAGITLLDEESLTIGGFAIVGGYGHFDLGHALPGARNNGRKVSAKAYLSGRIGNKSWSDMRRIPNCAKHLASDALDEATGIAERMDSAIADEKRLLLAVHTCPWVELNGWAGDGTDAFAAYSGNSLVGDVIENRAADVDFLMCGHTHFPQREQMLHGITSLNVGSDYGVFRGVVYDVGTKEIEWVGEGFVSK